jgi:hypothetical protein
VPCADYGGFAANQARTRPLLLASKLQLPEAMRTKIYGGTVLNSEKSLCARCRFATIVRGRTLDEEIVHCGSITTRGMRVTFKVTSCTSHSDIDQPSYMELLEDAWILRPASKRKPAGFVKNSELRADEIQEIMRELRESERG